MQLLNSYTFSVTVLLNLGKENSFQPWQIHSVKNQLQNQKGLRSPDQTWPTSAFICGGFGLNVV